LNANKGRTEAKKMTELKHTPVLLAETLDLLNLRKGMNVVDCTLGLGGHSLEILKQIGPKGRLLAFDQDAENLERSKKRLSKYLKQITFVHSNFENLKAEIERTGFPTPDAILFDFGLSSPHVDDPERGFSFHKDGPLDMRFDRTQRLTAEKIVNTYTEEKLSNLIHEYGEERRARLIAKRIIHHRRLMPFKTTKEFSDFLISTLGWKEKNHPATRTFQALRIAVNRELETMETALHQAVEVLKPKGRVVAIAYHSLEDRIVKNVFRYYTQECICPKYLPVCQCNFKKKLYLLTKKPIIPSDSEVQSNPRARSAKLRGAERI
jgi:16S rRNA (cytosine1402-N4)-methyltransferase